MKELAGVGVLVVCLTVAPGSAQQKSTTGQFDGKYVGSMKCAGTSNVRLNGLTIRQSKFTFTFKTTRGAGANSCALQVMPDGSFNNQTCELPMTGKITGDKLELQFKAPEAICDVTATREKS